VAVSRAHTPRNVSIAYREHDTALHAYREALFDAVRKRVQGHERVGVLFSGGVDSCMVARIASMFCDEVIAYVGGVEGAPDLAHAQQAAAEMNLPLRTHHLSEEALEELMPEVVAAIEDRSLIQVEVALPMFAALKLAKEDGIRVVLSGQGADEIFAGYEWYPRIFTDEGEAALIRAMRSDLSNLYRDSLEREDKVSMWHSIELRVPFLDPHVIDEAMRITPALKLHQDGDGIDRLGKRLHRELALEVGVPERIAMRAKDGAQHGSGIHEAVEQLAEDLPTTGDGAPVDLDENELRGSAFRHGGIDVEQEVYGAEQAQELVDDVAGEVFEDALRARDTGIPAATDQEIFRLAEKAAEAGGQEQSEEADDAAPQEAGAGKP
jgi:asparagine synthase (glutamine-hydrolysing)